jgi:peptide/nickel transport system substrate-binding protein
MLGGLALAGAGVSVFGLTACENATAPTGSARPTTRAQPAIATIDLAQEPASLSGLANNHVYIGWIYQQVNDFLYTFDEKLMPQPMLAAELPRLIDDLHAEIKLKSGISFHNGDEFTAEHVAATLNTAALPGHGWTGQLSTGFQRAEAVDKSTVRITLKQPWGVLIDKLQCIPIIHKDWVDRRDSMMGTGPFVFEEHKQGSFVRLSANPKYHGGAPQLGGLQFRFVGDPGARLVNVLRGDSTVYPAVNYRYVELIQREPNVVMLEEVSPSAISMRVNLAFPPFADIRVRQALGYAMDRTRIRDVVFAGKATLGQGPAGPPSVGWDPSRMVYPPRPDIDRSKSLLREAGIKDGQTINFSWVTYNDDIMRDLGPVLKDDWAKVGLNAQLEYVEVAAWAARTPRGGQYGFKISADWNGTVRGLDGLSTALYKDNPINTTEFQDEESTTLALKAEATRDIAERGRLVAQWSEMVARKGAWLSPGYAQLLVAHTKKLEGLPAWKLRVAQLDFSKAVLT